MSKPPAKKLKIILSEENTAFVRREAREQFTTPPRFIDRFLTNLRNINAKLPRKKESMEDRFKRETGFELGNPRSRKAVAS